MPHAGLWKETALLALSFWTPGLQSRESINFCFKPPACAGLLGQPQDSKMWGVGGVWFSAGQLQPSPFLDPEK